jgi:hypothetical protein
MMSDLPPWTKINKGDRRPTERVLVSYDYEDLLDGQKRWGVTGAWWNPKRQHWVADHGKSITNVTHWMPMPTGRRNE